MDTMKLVRVAIASLGLLAGGVAHAAYIEILPATSVEVGSAASLEVWMNGLSDEFVGGYDLTIDFDPLLVSFLGVEFGDSLNDPADPDLEFFRGATPGAGNVNVFELSLLFDLTSVQDGTSPFRLFTLNFSTLATGAATFSFGSTLMSDELGGELLLSQRIGNELTILPSTSVPEPGPMSLLVLGLAGLALRRRRR